ncbi:MAG TPA: acetyl-CoA carboxylase biotin carboxyl carrier protein [Candidatus Hydrogenedentes bacterium]|nr:acetyl-CoA carboxylase biotin carboxyl carrier protein [Candidatus Hydrogenedentota bacterium]HOV62072.1 acetyl-CoA carboxylase biotin carboxyl carrier protein [Candidatus Hydrogenedentota bacterium]
MDLSELQELIRLFESTGLSEIEIEEGGRRIRLAKKTTTEIIAGGAVVPVVPATVPGAGMGMGDAPGMGAKGKAGEESPRLEEGLITIDSPMVGTFYDAPGPGEPPFVQPGDTVDAGQVVCIVEAMKIMNEVTAKVPAIVEQVLVRNGEPVEYGQPLFAVRPLA